MCYKILKRQYLISSNNNNTPPPPQKKKKKKKKKNYQTSKRIEQEGKMEFIWKVFLQQRD